MNPFFHYAQIKILFHNGNKSIDLEIYNSNIKYSSNKDNNNSDSGNNKFNY